jgi:S1-C subfamily serine protease
VLLALIFVLIFWKLFYPSLARDAALAAIDPGALQSSNVDALQAEIEAYRAALAGDVCVAPPLADAAPLFRHKTPPPQAPGEGGEAGSGKGAAPAEPPANLPPPLNPTAGDEVESATVLVISIGPSDSGTGTGFFINDRQLLTNRHVVEGALRGGKVAITSKILGGLLECEILAVTDENEVLRDYALLQVTGARAHASLRFSDRAKRSERVGAWGYPAINTELDPSMKALLGGDVTSAPEVVYTEGVISVVQRAQGLPPFISHTAEVSHGNSGGPLVNGAGEVLGINTAIRTDKESNRQVNIAVASEDVMEFLRANGVSFDLSADAT